MKYNYCTVFDKGFLNRGLALHRSVLRYSQKPFRHFILCVDDETYDILGRLNLEHVVRVQMKDFEASDPKILAAKGNRNHIEYMWTLSSVFTSYVLKHYDGIEYLTYLDADLYFYASPEIVFHDMGAHSILIIPHNLPPEKRILENEVGKYNVGLVIFKNDENGNACLNWWKNECLLWCYEKSVPGKYGDQKYLDYFEEKFNGVFVYRHKGADLAGWNIKNFIGKIYKENDHIMVDGDPLIFFHFSAWKQYFPKSHFLPFGPLGTYNYIIPSSQKTLIYNEYAEAIYAAMRKIREIIPDFTFGTVPRPPVLVQIRDIVMPRAILVLKNTLRSFVSKK